MEVFIIILFLPVLMSGCIIAGFHLGWWATNHQYGDPYNWRVCLGPFAYMEWLTENNEHDSAR